MGDQINTALRKNPMFDAIVTDRKYEFKWLEVDVATLRHFTYGVLTIASLVQYMFLTQSQTSFVVLVWLCSAS